MGTLSDLIEKYISELLQQGSFIELQRRELAKIFQCAPSQINYVLETRFTTSHGYLVESRRGGGGYIRIIKIIAPQVNIEEWPQRIGDAITDTEAKEVLLYLREHGILSSVAASLLYSTLKQSVDNVRPEQANELRAVLLKNLLLLLHNLDK